MNLKQLVEQLDAQVLSGDIIGAFKTFFADDAVTLSGPNDITHTKSQKLDALEWFFSRIARSNRVVLLSCGVGDDVTHSEYIFDFTDKYGNNLVWNEVIRRRWKDGKVINEKYYTAGYVEDIDKVAPSTSKKTTTSTTAFSSGATTSSPIIKVVTGTTSKSTGEAPKTTAASSEPKATKTTTSVKTTKVASAKKETPKTTVAKPAPEPKKSEKAPAPAKAPTPAKAPAKPDDLTLIEGIGPKINELLQNAGIKTFAQLAESKPAAIKTILDAAGKRYQIHDPSTWPQQSALARDGKTAELAKFQDELKGGKK